MSLTGKIENGSIVLTTGDEYVARFAGFMFEGVMTSIEPAEDGRKRLMLTVPLESDDGSNEPDRDATETEWKGEGE